jgi:hypothetical protein
MKLYRLVAPSWLGAVETVCGAISARLEHLLQAMGQ